MSAPRLPHSTALRTTAQQAYEAELTRRTATLARVSGVDAAVLRERVAAADGMLERDPIPLRCDLSI